MLRKARKQLSQDDFNTWIRPLKGNLNKNTLELVAPNDFILKLRRNKSFK
jgi:chromosomal replication initiator protein